VILLTVKVGALIVPVNCDGFELGLIGIPVMRAE